MKFEMVSGDESLFDGAPEWALFVYSYDGERYWEEHKNPTLGGKYQCVDLNDVCIYDFFIHAEHEQTIIAERRPITEPEWNGEGLPPVGVECEFQAALGDWVAIRITAHGEDSMLMKQVGKDNEQYISKDRKFRPMRSADEIAHIISRSKECDKIFGILSSVEREGNRSDMAEALYDAGYRKLE